jgi:hypothetical protein
MAPERGRRTTVSATNTPCDRVEEGEEGEVLGNIPGATWTVKVAKSTFLEALILALEMIRIFGGSPIPVAVPPMFEKICTRHHLRGGGT